MYPRTRDQLSVERVGRRRGLRRKGPAPGVDKGPTRRERGQRKRAGPAGAQAALGAFFVEVAAQTWPWPKPPRRSVWEGQRTAGKSSADKASSQTRRNTGGVGGSKE